MKIKEGNLEERIYSLRIGANLEIVSEKDSIIVLDKGIIMCVTDNWIDAMDYIEQMFSNEE